MHLLNYNVQKIDSETHQHETLNCSCAIFKFLNACARKGALGIKGVAVVRGNHVHLGTDLAWKAGTRQSGLIPAKLGRERTLCLEHDSHAGQDSATCTTMH